MKFDELASATLPHDVHRAVVEVLTPRWKGARIYMPANIRRRPRNPPLCAAERFANEMCRAVVDSGGHPAQAEELLTALSAGYFWV
ncbi:MAG: hypothetical protein OXK73_12990 [Rhodospirillaceae bacterium]|nr:hypothetical protein [Rhodospirillaceae bacterium]